ncbi:MAG TPA: TonB family protein [Candidatus Acidoferrum sp.]|nr:TonB family protein [Candidatus Acidoferrum sp.]
MTKIEANARGNPSLIALASAILLALPASAQSPRPSASEPAPPQTPAPPQSAPLHKSANCDLYLPPGFKVPPESTPTLFWFRVDQDGSAHVLSLYSSSGNSDLDHAALACANSALGNGKPLTQDGTPIEVTWVGAISWNYPWHHLILPEPSGKAHLCGLSGYLKLGVMAKPMGADAIVSYRVATDGSVKDAMIMRSAGSGYLDRAALDCVSAWRYLPAFHNGVPVEIDRKTEVRVEPWRR